MDIQAKGLGRRFNKNWIFSGFEQLFPFPCNYAILGPNGSGKSTLLQVLSGYLSPSSGTLDYQIQGKKIEPDLVYQKISFLSPILEIPMVLTVEEFFQFHFGLKGIYHSDKVESWIDSSGLREHRKKSIGTLSSGLLQRVKLISAFGSKTPILLLDEPTMNLDEAGIEWFTALFHENKNERTLILGSNLNREFELCDHQIHIMDYKK